MIFACHPQRLESVAWVAERKDVLSVFFWMLGLLAYVHHVRQPSPCRMMWVTVCLILGGMAKPTVVTFPLALLLLDFWPLRRFGSSMAEFRANVWPLIREKIPVLAICPMVAVMAIWSESYQGSIVPLHFPWYLKLCRVIENVWFYFETFFVPTGLAIVHRIEKLDYLHVALAGLALAAITLLVLWRMSRSPWLVTGWFWFLFTLAPVASFIQIGPVTVADRYNYLPSVGLAVAVVFSTAEAMARWPRIRSWVMGGLAGWILICALETWACLPRWRNTFTVFESAYYNGAHYIACDHLGSLLYARQKFRDSIAVCNRGLAENPGFASLYNTRGGDYYMLGDLASALADFNRAIEASPSFSPSYYSRALVHIQRKQFVEARADLKEYLHHGGQLDPSMLTFLHNE